MPDLPVSEALQTPIIVPLAANLSLCRFAEPKKIAVARGVAERAWEAGELDANSRVFVSSSGSFGLGWATVSAELGLPMTLVSQPSIAPLQAIFEGMGVEVVIVKEPDPEGGYQQARLEKLNSLAADHPAPFIPHPYDDPRIVESYGPVAESIVDALGEVPDVVVDVTGSGGSLMSFTKALRSRAPKTKAVAVDTYGSCLFGRDAGERGVSGMGNSVMPEILDHSVVDQVHWLPADQVNAAARQLLQDSGLFMGPTTGAAVAVGKWVARRNPHYQVLAIGADSGWRYRDSVFDEGESGQVDSHPREVTRPRSACRGKWCYMNWGRRSLSEVVDQKEEPPKVDV